MLGFLIGTICLIALFRVARRGRACGSSCGGGGRWGRHDRAGHRNGWQRWLFRDLDASPGQERVLQGAVEDLQRAAEGARKEWAQARATLAEALSGESFDETAVQKAYARMEIEAQQIRDRFLENMRSVHEVLSPEQRRRLATLMSRGV